MPVSRMSQARKDDRSFRILAIGGILAGVIMLFSFFEPEGTSHSTNIVLVIIMCVIVLGTVGYVYVLGYMDAKSRLKGEFEWELTSDNVFRDTETAERSS